MLSRVIFVTQYLCSNEKGNNMQHPKLCPNCKTQTMGINTIKGTVTDCECRTCKSKFHIKTHRTSDDRVLYYLAELNPALLNKAPSFDGMDWDELGKWIETRLHNDMYLSVYPYAVE